jgi:hypothetical protein
MANLSIEDLELKEKALKIAISRYPTTTNYISAGILNQGQESPNNVTAIETIFKEAEKIFEWLIKDL